MFCFSLDAGRSHSLSGESYHSSTPKGTPNSSQWGTTAASAAHYSSVSINSSPSNDTVGPSNVRTTGYGTVYGDHIQRGTSTDHDVLN